jgi:hypothetical protein
MKANQIQPGNLMAYINWVRVVDAKPNELKVEDLDTHQEFLIRGASLIEKGMSADVFSSTKGATKTELAEILIGHKNTPMTVTYVKLNGEVRVVRCKWLSHESLMGRSMIWDFDKGGLGQIDHRTIQSIIVDDVKYMLKK